MDFETSSKVSDSTVDVAIGEQLYGSTFDFIAADGTVRTALVACNFNLWERRFFPLTDVTIGEYMLPRVSEEIVTWDGMRLSINSSDTCSERLITYLWVISLCRSVVPADARYQIRFYMWVQYNSWDVPNNGQIVGNGTGATDALFNSFFSATRMRIVSIPNSIPFAQAFEYGGINVFPDLAFGRVCQQSVRRYIAYCCNQKGFLPIVPMHSLHATVCGQLMYGVHSVDIKRVGNGCVVENTIQETLDNLRMPGMTDEYRVSRVNVEQTKLDESAICVTNCIRRTAFRDADFVLSTDNGLVEFNIAMDAWVSNPEPLVKLVDALVKASYPGPSDTQVQIILANPEAVSMPLSVAAYIIGAEDLPPDVRFMFEFEVTHGNETDGYLWIPVKVGVPEEHQLAHYFAGDYGALSAETVEQGIQLVKAVVATYACIPPVARAAFQRIPTVAASASIEREEIESD